MKRNLFLYQLIVVCLFVSVFACSKSVSSISKPLSPTNTHDSTPAVVQHKTDTQAVQNVPYPQAPVSGCSYAPDYGDSIIYTQPTIGQDYIVKPVNNPGLGKYFSWPGGMVIDSLSGAINVTKSQTGQRYDIGFVKTGTTDTCLKSLIIAGAAYMDSVYVLASNEKLALPYFNANPYLLSVCAGNGPGCQFVSNNAKVIVNPLTGVIDLQKTLDGTGGLLNLGGAFGLLPLDGATATTRIYYSLNDPSNNALQHIDINFIYYTYKSQIGQGLLTNLLTKLTNVLTGNLISKSANPRPPVIIITRYN
jgi:hypothetical protein